MNAAHLHLLVTHVPTMAAIFGLVLLMLAFFKRSEDLKQTSLIFFLLAGVAAVPAYLTGHPAHDVLVKMPVPVSQKLSDQHAEIAILALAASLALGVVSLAGLVRYRRGKCQPAWFLALVLVLALLTTAALGWTAHLGGKIRHPEISVFRQIDVSPGLAHK
jgi:hypothetical protein